MREARRFQAVQGLLTVEGLGLGVLGGIALAWSVVYTRFGADGIPLLGLKVTPLHAGLLLTVGSLALLASLGRWTTLIFSTVTACGWAVLAIVCALKVAHHAPGALGFDPRDRLLYGALSAYNLVVSLCLALTLFKARSESRLALRWLTAASGRRHPPRRAEAVATESSELS
ncbi:hypothetical protein [Mycobacterium sp.]|uniref:hypothetical protein n=1 Tax=Mycobacterium sp. TaxID=1785 RepID=UPI002B69EA3A|nr:hypothetical protein [Mycobacterium sp.]HKP42143.1 hypothetical protein [Mycobacterium sp.]